MSLPAPPTSP